MDGSACSEPGSSVPDLGDCFDCQLLQGGDLEGIEEATLSAIVRERREGTFRRSEDIYLQGDRNDGFYCLLTGVVALTLTDVRGNMVCVAVVRAGEAFGYRSLLAGERHCVTATAMTRCRVCHLPRDAASALIARYPDLLGTFTRGVARVARQSQEAFLRHATMNVRQKVLHFLVRLGGGDPDAGAGGRLEFALPLRRADIATLIGIVPETLSRMTKRLEKDGIVRFPKGGVVIPDLAAVRHELVDWDRPYL